MSKNSKSTGIEDIEQEISFIRKDVIKMAKDNVRVIGLTFNMDKLDEDDRKLYEVFASMKMSKASVVLALLSVFLREHGIGDYNPERALAVLLASRYGFLDEFGR